MNPKKFKTQKKLFWQVLLVSICLSYFLVNTGWSETYQFVLKWGSKGFGSGQFYTPHGVAIDTVGNVYVSDVYIQKFNSNGNYITQWGSRGTGNGQFNVPWGIAIDKSGNIYVADFYNNRVQKFDSNGNYITQWGVLGTGIGQFYNPSSIAIDISGNVYVADSNNDRVQKFDSSGNYITTWGSTGTGNGQFIVILDIACDSFGHVLVGDSGNSKIQVFDSDGNYITHVGGSYGTGNGQFKNIGGVAVDTLGNIYVMDLGNYRVQKFSPNGTYITQWGSLGTGDGQFSPSSHGGIAVDNSGNVYVIDAGNYRIQKFTSTGNICNATINPISQSFSSSGGRGNVTIMIPNGCDWTTIETLNWVSINSGNSGSGNGTVSYSVSANSGATRTGTITIAGQTFTITQTDTIFGDISSTDWSYVYVQAIYDQHITTGCSQNPLNYCPNSNVTRGQMAAFIVRSLYGETFAYTQTPYFTDVPTTNGFFKYVQKLRDVGITTVMGSYGVEDNVTRGQMAAFIIRAKYGESFSYTMTPYYTDVPADNIYFKYIQKLRDVGITTTTGTYMINDIVTRDQMAAFLARSFLGMD
jgi:DNA-binding beta-propeller fold protein YncE